MVIGHGDGVYSYNQNKDDIDFDTFRIAVRPAYIWDTYNQSGVELGYFIQKEKENNGDKGTVSGYKTTLFHTLKVAKSMLRSRPEIRFYISYIKATETDFGGPNFESGDNHQLTIGAQVDAAWF